MAVLGFGFCTAGPVRAGDLSLRRYQNRFVSIGQQPRRRFGLISSDPAQRLTRQRRETIPILRMLIGIQTLCIKDARICRRKEIYNQYEGYSLLI